jgi:hypothetical protein
MASGMYWAQYLREAYRPATEERNSDDTAAAAAPSAQQHRGELAAPPRDLQHRKVAELAVPSFESFANSSRCQPVPDGMGFRWVPDQPAINPLRLGLSQSNRLTGEIYRKSTKFKCKAETAAARSVSTRVSAQN